MSRPLEIRAAAHEMIGARPALLLGADPGCLHAARNMLDRHRLRRTTLATHTMA